MFACVRSITPAWFLVNYLRIDFLLMFSIIVCISNASITFVLFVFPLKVHLLEFLVGHHYCKSANKHCSVPSYNCSSNHTSVHPSCLYALAKKTKNFTNACQKEKKKKKERFIRRTTGTELICHITID